MNPSNSKNESTNLLDTLLSEYRGIISSLEQINGILTSGDKSAATSVSTSELKKDLKEIKKRQVAVQSKITKELSILETSKKIEKQKEITSLNDNYNNLIRGLGT